MTSPKFESNVDELMDLVDHQDSIVQIQWRSKIHDHPELYARAVLIFVTNAEGTLCFFRRTADKTYAPNQWALVGGCVQSGESYEQAAIREIEEEINVTPNAQTLRYLGLVTPQEYPGKFFKGVFVITVDMHNVPFNKDDFSELRWMSLKELEALSKTGDLLVHDLLYLVRRFYS